VTRLPQRPPRTRLVPLVAVAVLGLLVALPATPAPASTVGGSGQVRYGVSRVKGFDACEAPTANKMQAWWNGSPYYDTSIYLGGVNRACDLQPNLTSSWVSTVHSQGWSFYLLWAGLQAPCVNDQSNEKMSSNLSLAAAQGSSEANAAWNAAHSLGFTGLNIIYYNMEAYNTTNTTCVNAVRAFINAWVDFFHQVGEKAGAYGGACSGVTNWTSITNPPDSVWIAAWNNDPDVWGLPCVNNGYWCCQQRVHQYAGTHSETWGGVALSIDNDCAYGLVTPHGHSVIDYACTNE